ncbi:MAG: RIP metalloprotease RseP [Oscillospiraceae bacterium]|nr:RIP metalloprotease RseP [Oscillospiraceae bacterium]
MIYIYILLAVLAFGFLIFVHEFGHFITAKLSGVRVNEFALGMGPAIFKFTKGETLYALRILPIGGFCAMEGEDKESDDPKAFGSKSVWKRILIVVAGSAMNLIIGFVLLTVFLAPTERWVTPTVAEVVPEYMAESGIQVGDTVTSIDGYRIYLANDLLTALSLGKDAPYYTVEVLRDGERVTLERVKFELHTYERDGKTVQNYGVLFKTEESTFGGKVKLILQNAYNLVRMVHLGLVQLLTGQVGMDDVAGPIGIGKMMVETAQTSLFSLLFLIAFISINLGIMNLLPIPALDGGRLLFLLIELIRGKPINPKYEGYVHAAGLVILMGFMIFVAFHDIWRLIFA